MSHLCCCHGFIKMSSLGHFTSLEILWFTLCVTNRRRTFCPAIPRSESSCIHILLIPTEGQKKITGNLKKKCLAHCRRQGILYWSSFDWFRKRQKGILLCGMLCLLWHPAPQSRLSKRVSFEARVGIEEVLTLEQHSRLLLSWEHQPRSLTAQRY